MTLYRILARSLYFTFSFKIFCLQSNNVVHRLKTSIHRNNLWYTCNDIFSGIDALDIDWASLQQDVRPKPPVTGSALNRFKASNVFAQIGVSKQYAGEELFNKIQNECIKQEDSTGKQIKFYFKI